MAFGASAGAAAGPAAQKGRASRKIIESRWTQRDLISCPESIGRCGVGATDCGCRKTRAIPLRPARRPLSSNGAARDKNAADRAAAIGLEKLIC